MEKAVSDITLLQDNLAYVIRVKEELEADLTVRERREQVIIQQFEKELHKKERELEGGQEREEEMISLLKDTKDSLECEEISRRQREDEVRRMERII